MKSRTSIWLSITISLLVLSIDLIQCDESSTSNDEHLIELNDQLKSVAIDLLKQSSNQTFVAELLANQNAAATQIQSYPSMDESIGKVYKQMTQSQIEALQNELQLHDHFIYEPIREKCTQIQIEFEKSSDDYDQTRDIYRLERDFLNTGDQLVSLQKMVIRIINSKLEQRLRQPKHQQQPERQSSMKNNYGIGQEIFDQFDYLCRSFFGIPFSNFKTSTFTPINQLLALTERLQMVDAIRLPTMTNNDGDNGGTSNLNGLSALLHRLRHTYFLYRMATYSNQIMDTFYLKPLAYQATLDLVDTVGYLTWSDPSNNLLLSQLRFLIQLFSGNLQLNIFAQPNLIKQQSSSAKNLIDPNQLKQLIQTLKQHEQKQRDQIEQNRLRSMMEKLMDNQQRQQSQIDKILHHLASSKHDLSTTTTTTTTTAMEKPKKHPYHHQSSTTTIKAGHSKAEITTTTTTLRPSESIVKGGDTLTQLKQQRKLLNDLLQELQKPLNHTDRFACCSSHSKPPSMIKPSMPNDKQKPFHNYKQKPQQDLGQTQQALMTIMQNITPLINVMAQSQMIRPSKLDQSRLDLLSIVQSINNNQQILLDSSSSILDFTAPFNVMTNLAKRLQQILDGFINDLTPLTAIR